MAWKTPESGKFFTKPGFTNPSRHHFEKILMTRGPKEYGGLPEKNRSYYGMPGEYFFNRVWIKKDLIASRISLPNLGKGPKASLCLFRDDEAGKFLDQNGRGRVLLGLLGLVAGGPAFVVGEIPFPKANAFWGDFDQFVVFDKFQGKFQGHVLWRNQMNGFI